jgi:hypothetical protein
MKIVDTFHAVRVADPEDLPDGKVCSFEMSISTYEITCCRNQKKGTLMWRQHVSYFQNVSVIFIFGIPYDVVSMPNVYCIASTVMMISTVLIGKELEINFVTE